MSDAESAATANEEYSAMRQTSPVGPHGAQRNSCSGVVDTTAGLRQAKLSEAPTQPLSPDRQQSGGIGATRSPPFPSQSSISEDKTRRGCPRKVRIEEAANEVIEIRSEGRGRAVSEQQKKQIHALPEGALPPARPMTKEEREKHDKWLEEQMTKELEGEDGASSPEYVTDDELFGGDESADEKLIDAALKRSFEDVEELPEVGEDLIDVEEVDDKKKVLRNPGDPTMEEYEAHRVDHMPYRSYCPHCVNGRATGHKHKSQREEQRVPQLGFDYLHGTESFALASGEEETVKILVAKCHQSKCIFAHVVPQKGLDPALYAVERLKRDVMWLGHTRLVLKSDNERAILALLRNTLKVLQKEVEIENIQEAHPAAYDSSSNGSTENASKQVGNMISTVRSCLEDRIKMKVPVTHCLFGWLVEHAAWLLTTRQRQSDGLTPHQRLRGRSFGTAMLCFGERCHYKLPKPKHERALEGKLGSKWKEALFLGYSRGSNEYLVWSIEDQALVRARSLQRKPSVGRWSSEELMKVNLRPQDAFYRSTAEPTGRREPSQRFEDRVAPEDESAPS